MRRLLSALVLVGAVLIAPAWPQEFDDAFEDALTHWRAATWYARLQNSGVAGLELEEFRAKWSVLAERFQAPPAPFTADQSWRETVQRVGSFAETAAIALDADDSNAAATALAGIGDTLAELRRRNGVVGFSDIVARYRDALAEFSALTHDDGLTARRVDDLRTQATRLAAAVAELDRHVPPRWRGNGAFETLLRQNQESVTTLVAALERRDPAPSALEITGLLRVVRSNYNLLFLRFGAMFSREHA